MKNLKGACIFAQSGGPTSVINASAAGVFIEALGQENITKVYGAAHGIKGILTENFYDMGQEDMKELELLKYTPSSALGSVRYKLKDASVDDTDYKRILEVFKKYDIRYFFYNGGNDSMDTCNKISKYMASSGYECNVIGVPKTIDNDLFGTDHCPGYGSAAKYVATTLMEVNLDAKVYDTGMVCIIEVMGRNAGWLTASAALAGTKGLGADLIYLPEVPFDMDKFVADVKDVCAKNNNKCIAVVSEGIKFADGKYVGEFKASATDLFGHAQLGGVCNVLAGVIKQATGIKVRGIEFSLMQRCAAHLASKTDIEETFRAGREAVKAAVSGETDKMVCYERKAGDKYEIEYKLLPLELAANTEKQVPKEWITANGTGLTEDFVKYALPLIQGDAKAPLEDGLPRFAQLKKVLATK
ncbi:MAG: 6-phosphofructokinase [Christensenellaceae bacterium]|nr:6-phosphofructokinase [Christensenellaceae bacterium]MDD6927134.1 6-phosphofructokinase [bacterium]MDY2850918.1 6-phosphofructokinase [Christensenellaceae bacterium]